MSRAREATYALFGAYRLARLDASGLQYFNATVQGFWRSFTAALIVAPGYAILVGLELGETPDAASLDWGSIALVQAVFYAISWIAFPLAMHILTELIDRQADYVRYIVAYNWAAVLQMGVMLPAAALQAMIPGTAGGLILLPVWAATTFYQWFIARTTLRIGRATAAGIVGVDLALSLAIAWLAMKVRNGGFF